MKLVCYDDGLGLHVSHFLQSSPGISIKIFTVPCFTGFLFHHLQAAPNFFNLSAGWHLVLYLDFPNALAHLFFNDLCCKIICLKFNKNIFVVCWNPFSCVKSMYSFHYFTTHVNLVRSWLLFCVIVFKCNRFSVPQGQRSWKSCF